MQKVKKGEFGHLDYKKKLNLIIAIIAFAIILAIFIIGWIVNGTRNNIATVAAIVLVLPAAKFAVAYFVLLPHKSASKELAEKVNSAAEPLGVCFDLIFSNKKSPIGTQAVVVSDSTIVALTCEEKADIKLFETSLVTFMETDKLHVTVTLYKDEKTFLKRVANLAANFDETKENAMNKIEWNTNSLMNMCL
ncbi:MAG: hypothetical protein IJB96_01610 [Lachnospira sp.]|nr:hypothetical protein [Lachnospira sp.]